MAIIKCKMCGGDLTLTEGMSIAECEFCGTTQTVPKVDDEKKLTLFARANRLRAACEFDKAAGIYESIVADFPEEAEAYWGLVLCKYGIEYVDDPGTGKKVPTCHRSSFDSVTEDSDYEQALENADGTSRKLYREEAKQIETIRKGIIAVSANEAPYDIFICYKETAENGDRTLDSVLAQDIYDLLTSKDYRVFFARITLEDKLGQEYEPYIFAALNSAKIMLAVGTDYEYFNAVWVKNEWGRYLKLMAKDKEKHLIPCYKNIDPYDMPKEFAKLQAQDLGKMGAYQDLLRGVEKLLPKKEAPVVVEVSRGLSPNIQSLVKRAYIFLEDKDWTNADKYFDDILDIDPECAEAYLGKCLVQHKCTKPEGLSIARTLAYRNAKGETVSTDVAQKEREHALLKEYLVPGYLGIGTMTKLLPFNNTYVTTVADRQRQLETEKQWFAQDRNMSRAMRYASGEFKVKLEGIRGQILTALEEQVRNAKQSDADNVRNLGEGYEKHLADLEIKFEKMHGEAIAQRNQDLQEAINTANAAIEENARKPLEQAKEKLKPFEAFENAAVLLATMDDMLEVIAAQEEAERQRIEEEQRIARQRKAEAARFQKEVEDAYYEEYPLARAKNAATSELSEINTKLNELEKKLHNKTGIAACWIFFLLGIVEFIIGVSTSDAEFLAIIGGICGLGFGIALIAVAKNRKKMRKERKTLIHDSVALRQKLRDIDKIPTLDQFTRTYTMRQTEEGRSLLEREARMKEQQLQQQQEAARRAKVKRTIKNLVTFVIAAAVFAAAAFGLWYVTAHLIPGSRVTKAQAAYDAGNYREAFDILNGYEPYGDSDKLLEKIAEKGEYRITQLAVSSNSSYSDYIYAYEYDENGNVQYILAYEADNPDENSAPAKADFDRGYYLEYAFYSSGNLKRVSFTDLNTGNLRYKAEFYDSETSRLNFILASDPTPSQGTSVEQLRFVGLKKYTYYYNDGSANVINYQENGFETSTSVVLNDDGQVVEMRSGSSKTTYTYNKDGSLKVSDYDSDTAGSSTYSDETLEYSYKKDFSGKLTEYSYKEDWRDVAERKEIYSYNEAGQLTQIRVETRQDAKYSDDYLSWYFTKYVTYQWVDFAEAAANQTESAGLERLQVGQLETAMERSFLEALELLEDMEPVGEAKELAEILNAYAPYCGTFCKDDDLEVIIQSDFIRDRYDILWNCRQENPLMGVQLGEDVHDFFMNTLVVSDMRVEESYEYVDATVSFAPDGYIYYDVGYWTEVQRSSSGKITSKSNFADLVSYRYIPLEEAEAAAAEAAAAATAPAG